MKEIISLYFQLDTLQSELRDKSRALDEKCHSERQQDVEVSVLRENLTSTNQQLRNQDSAVSL